MSTPLTQYGVDDLQTILNAFSDLGNDILSGTIDEFTDINQKELRKFKMKEACEMIGRSDGFLRNLEKTDPSFEPEKLNGMRYYTLDLINRIRDKAGTRYKRPEGSEPIKQAISHFKGGVGKSTISNSLACKMALEGLKVLSIGLDGQGTDALYYGIIPDIHISSDETIKQALLEEPSAIKGLIKKTFFPGIDIIPGNLTLTQVEMSLTNYQEQMHQVKKLGFPDERLFNALKYIEKDYDVIIFDCGPNLNILTLNAINACNSLLVPIPPALPDVASFSTYCKTLKEHLEHSDKLKSLEFFRILVTKNPKNKSSENILRMMLKEFGFYLMQKNIVYSAEIERAASNFCSIYEMPTSSKKTYKRGLEAMDSVFNEILDAYQEIWQAQVNKEDIA